MAWWERPLARLRGDRTPSAPSAAPAVASVPAPGEWNDVPRLQRVLADPITPVAINDDFRASLASFSDPSLLAPLSHRVDPSVGGLVEGLASPGRPHLHDGPELVVPRSAPAAPTVQRRTTWGADATELAVVPLEYRHPAARVVDLPGQPAAEPVHPDAEPAEAGVTGPAASLPEPSEPVAEAAPDAPLVAEAAPAPVAGRPTEPGSSSAASDLPVVHRHAEASVTAPPAVQRTVVPGSPQTRMSAETASGPAAVPVPRTTADQPAAQRSAEPGHAARPVVSGGVPREPSPADRTGSEPAVAPAAAPGPSAVPPVGTVVQRVSAPASEAPPVTTPASVQRAFDEPGAVEPDAPGFTELPLVVAPAPSGSDAEAMSAGTPESPGEGSRPLLGEHAEPLNPPVPPKQPVVQSLPSARELPVAGHPPAPRTTGDAAVVQRLPVSRASAESGSVARGVAAVSGHLPTSEPRDQPLLRQQPPVVQLLGGETPGQARHDGVFAGLSATEVLLPVSTGTSRPVDRVDPPEAPPPAERFVLAGDDLDQPAEHVPWAVFAPPIAAVQRRTAGAAPEPPAAAAANRPSVGRAPEVQRVTAEAPAGPQPQPPLTLVRSPSARASGTGPAPGEGMSFAAMFAGFAAESSASGSDGVDLQRQAAEAEPPAEPAEPTPEPAAATGAPGAAGAASAAAAAAAGGGNLDELARRLYEPLAARLREELWLDRERAGWMTELA